MIFPMVLQFLVNPNAPLSKERSQPPKSGDYLIEEKITVFLGNVFGTLPTAHFTLGYCLIQCHIVRSVCTMGQCYLIHAHSGTTVCIISWFAVDSVIAGSNGFQSKICKNT